MAKYWKECPRCNGTGFLSDSSDAFDAYDSVCPDCERGKILFHPACGEWNHNIGEAPKNGTTVLLLLSGDRVRLASYVRNQGWDDGFEIIPKSEIIAWAEILEEE